MRYYLDTNIIVFLFTKRKDLSCKVLDIITDYSNILYTSTTCVMELIHLLHRGDIVLKKGYDILTSLDDFGIEIIPVDKRHLLEMEHLTPIFGHNDPNDHIIIAQAISDRINLISSDTKFKEYQKQGLLFTYNRR